MDLRDRFASQFAAALVDAFADASDIARRAYDLSDAMLVERARRIDADERRAIERESGADALDAYLDALDPSGEEHSPSWLGEPYDPSWDLEPRWAAESAEGASSSRASGPGLTRTQPPDEGADRKERSA